MHKLIILTLLLTLVSCGIGKATKKVFTTHMDKTDKTLSTNLSGEETSFSGEYIQVESTKLKGLSCALDVSIIGIPVIMASAIIEGITKKKFSLIIPEKLSKKIFYDLRDKAKFEKIKVDNLWSTLDPELAKELNEFLLYKNLNKEDKSFAHLQKITAFGFALLVENGDFNTGYKFSYKLNTARAYQSIAFSYQAQEKKDLSHCQKFNLSDIAYPQKLLKPSDITTYLSCDDLNGATVKIERIKDEAYQISYNDLEVKETIKLEPFEAQIKKERKDYIEYRFETNDIKKLDIKFYYETNYDFETKTESIVKNDYDAIDFKLKYFGQRRIKLKDLNCRVTKPFKL